MEGFALGCNTKMSVNGCNILLIPPSQLHPILADKPTSEGHADEVVTKAKEVLQGSKSESDIRVVILGLPNEGEQELSDKMEMLAKNGNLKIELLSGMKSFEEFLIHAKPIIDEMDSAYVNIVSPKMETDNCKQIVSLIYNEKTYHIRLIKTDVDGNANEENCTGNDSLKAIKNILSAIPSADGLPLEILKSKMIPDDLFYHGFTTRSGGVSTYPTMKSLPLAMSLSKKDTRVYIEENRHRLARSEGFSYDSFYSASAVHGTDVWVIGDEEPPSYDAIATNKQGVTIAAPGADCQTILFCDTSKKVVAAAHSGWKGTIDRIQQNVVRVMKERFGCESRDICVAIGPSIGACCYDVDDLRAREFICSVGDNVVEKRNGKMYLNLWKVTRILLEQVGINSKNIDDGKRYSESELNGHCQVTQCTKCNSEKFFSYRRDGILFGNQIGFVGIKESPTKEDKLWTETM